MTRKVKQEVPRLPAHDEVVKDVAAALMKAKFRAAAEYMGELKLMHIERGYMVDDTLFRYFAISNAAVARGMEPADKAPEIWWEDTDFARPLPAVARLFLASQWSIQPPAMPCVGEVPAMRV